jgi:hypothetical protein
MSLASLLFLLCPVSMGLCMWLMRRGDRKEKGTASKTDEQES